MSSKVPPELLLPANAAGTQRAAELLRAGKLVILPTETVYGIAINLLSPEARATARAIKARASADPGAAPGPWVIHTGRVDDVHAWAPNLTPLGRRLINKSLPGPVAFQLKLTAADLDAARRRLQGAADESIQDGSITLRCPDFSVTQDVLAAVDAPIAIMGAGTTAQPSVHEVTDIPQALFDDSHIAAVIDGGPTRYRRSSTLVKIDGDQYSVLRPGVIDERIIDRMADFMLLFICSGNTCRSPMAAALATGLLAQKLGIPPGDLPLRHVVVQSAGLHASRGLRAAREAIEVISSMSKTGERPVNHAIEFGDLTRHISQPATPDLLRRADAIYTMTAAHSAEIAELYPWAERKTFELDPDADIADPIGSPISVYEKVAKRILDLLQQRLSEFPV
jgi:protein-tyrosine phosphatase